MIKVSCRTNIDLRNECWPKLLPVVPNVGDLIESSTTYNPSGLGCIHVELKVESVTWKHDDSISYENRLMGHGWYPEIYLGLPSSFMSLVHFHAWYDWVCGKITSDELDNKMKNIYSTRGDM